MTLLIFPFEKQWDWVHMRGQLHEQAVVSPMKIASLLPLDKRLDGLEEPC
jgi:hypothetical protein